LTAAVLREIYDDRIRTYQSKLPYGAAMEVDGPLRRYTGMGNGGFVSHRDLDGLTGDELDELIARQVRYFTERGEQFEWKLYGHDRPDLVDRLLAQGFRPEELETVVIGPVAPLAAAPVSQIPGVRLREVTDRADLDRIARMEERVWGDGSRDWLAEALDKERQADPESLVFVVAEADGLVVCAGWTRYLPGTEFATLWGGSTLIEYRRRGIYKAIVEYRARHAAERGYKYLQVDASPDSRPVLERLGLVQVATTTPYIYRP
jgi:ribosomal protein S18 acetylase RimI-like enzyme